MEKQCFKTCSQPGTHPFGGSFGHAAELRGRGRVPPGLAAWIRHGCGAHGKEGKNTHHVHCLCNFVQLHFKLCGNTRITFGHI